MALAERPLSLGPTIFLETFGCQMNQLDSELVHGQLTALGYTFTSDASAADVVLYNTCSVRAQAENKVLSRLGRLRERKEKGSRVIVGVIGCMAEREGRQLLAKYPQIDLLCGPSELDKLPMLLDNALKTEAVEEADRVALRSARSSRASALAAAPDNLELLDLSRVFDPTRAGGGASAYVRITRGCNKFCTYCVVPFTRGPEVNRPPDHIVEECRRLGAAGAVEITLLGQTVNHYAYTHGPAVTVGGVEAAQIGPGSFGDRRGGGGRRLGRVTTFADLLWRIHEEVGEIQRLRFVTSYPRDFGDDILSVMAQCKRICRYLHAPAQSGSDRILKLMNRGYSRREYLQFIDRVRDRLPDVMIAGDIIVGFPTETEADFAQTKDLMRRVGFKNNFIFKYSPRPGTAAQKRLTDDVPLAVKRRRNAEALALQTDISAQVHAGYVGRRVAVFVEKVSRNPGASGASGGSGVRLGWERSRLQMSGRTGGDLITVFDLPAGCEPENLLGRIVTVQVTGSGPLILIGRLLETPDRPLSPLSTPAIDQTSKRDHPGGRRSGESAPEAGVTHLEILQKPQT